jgi:hypothetical protein
MIELFQYFDKHLSNLLNRCLCSLSNFIYHTSITFIDFSLFLQCSGQLVFSLRDILFKQRNILLILMCFFRYFFVLFLELDHIVLQFEDFFFFGITYTLHLDDPVLENFI